VELNGKPTLLAIEFQSSPDETMQKRLLRYNVLSGELQDHDQDEQEDIDVWSMVIYLHKAGKVPQPPYIKRLANGWEVNRFSYTAIDLTHMKAEEIRQLGISGLLPLIPFTSNGAEDETLTQMVDELAAQDQEILLIFGKMMAGLVLKHEKERVERLFAMYKDKFKDNWVVQEWIQKGLEKGME